MFGPTLPTMIWMEMGMGDIDGGGAGFSQLGVMGGGGCPHPTSQKFAHPPPPPPGYTGHVNFDLNWCSVFIEIFSFEKGLNHQNHSYSG